MGSRRLARRGAYTIALLVVAAGLTLQAPAVGAGSLRSPATGQPPNILLLVSDDQAWSTFNPDLNPSVYAQLVDQGVLFNRAYDVTSECCPSRSEILTGLYEHHTGVDENTVPLTRPTIVQALHDHGYRTMLAGKYLNSWPCARRPEFDQWYCTDEQSSLVNPIINVNGTWINFTGYTSQILANDVSAFINSTPATVPFFAMFTPKSPHLPADDPRYDSMNVDPIRDPAYNQDTRNGLMPQFMQRGPLTQAEADSIDANHVNMAQSVRALDDDVSTILSSLGSRASNTLVFYISDNGYLYGEHRRQDKNAAYEESMKVPFIMRYPDVLPVTSAFTSDALVENIDIAPTIADVAGFHWGADGTSLIPILNGQATQVRTAALIEHCEAATYPCYYGGGRPPSFFGIITDQYAYWELVTNETELYDLTNDPSELTNLASNPAYAGVKADLSAQLAALRAPPPVDTTIVTGSQGISAGRTLSFTYFSQSRLARYECRLDANGVEGTWEPCDSQPFLVGPLPDGDYEFEVRGTDEFGSTDPTPDTRSFPVDTSGPDVEISDGPPPDGKSGNVQFTFGSFSNPVGFQCTLSLFIRKVSWVPCSPPTFSAQGLTDGLYSFQARAVDTNGVFTRPPAQWIFRVDNRGPVVTFDTKPPKSTKSTSATFSFRTDDPTTSMSCLLDAGGPFDCSSGSVTLQGLTEATHVLTVKATDLLGDVSLTPVRWTVDLTPPTASITSGPPPQWAQNYAVFTLSPPTPGRFLCTLDGGTQIICPPTTRYYALADGPHQLVVSAFDSAGNVSAPVTWNWTQDTTAPYTTITSGPADPTNQTSATFAFSSDDPLASYVCSIDGSPDKACASPTTLTGLTEGTHTFSVTGKDSLGNRGAPATDSWTIDLTAPIASITSGPADPTTETTATFVFGADDPNATFLCSLDPPPGPAPCTSPVTYTGLHLGDHLFEVTATDQAGNTGPPADYSWTITGPPQPGGKLR